MVSLVVFPDKYVKSCHEGITLWAITVLPSLLPFFFLTTLLTKTGAIERISNKLTPITAFLFRCSGLSAYAFIMSVLSGYPVGSRIVYDLKNQNLIDKDEASRISVLATTSGPLFVIGAVGVGMFGNKVIGIIIYLSHVLSAFFTAIIYRAYGKNTANVNLMTTTKSFNALYECIYEAVLSSLIVGGFVSIFYVFSQIISDFNLLFPIQSALKLIFIKNNFSKELASAFSLGIIECTRGCKMLSAIPSLKISVALTSSIISFGGISIIMQSIVYLKKANASIKHFLLGKTTQMAISFCLALLGFILLF
jgi:sporulation integral membrane protein YlbJ